MFQCLGWMRKNFIPGNFIWSVAAETWDASCFKKSLLEKQQNVPNTCTILPLEKIFFQNLAVNRWIFPSAKIFAELFNSPPSPKLEGVHALKAQLKLSPLIQNLVQQDYLPVSYARRHLPSYQKCDKVVASTRCGLFPLPQNLYR